jgi:lipopolysaccharide O-acetyltransferase
VNVRPNAFSPRSTPPVLHVGGHVQINGAVLIGAVEQVVIGDHVLIASRVFISDHNHGKLPNATCCIRTRNSSGKSATLIPTSGIGRSTWLAEQVCILPGATIGGDSIVGANSVVTRDISANSIAARNPERVIHVFDTSTHLWRRT